MGKQMEKDINARVAALEAQVEMLSRMVSFSETSKSYQHTLRLGEAPPTNEATGEGAGLLQFTPKQIASVQMCAEGYSTEEMAEVLDCTTSTVKVHIRGYCKRIGVSSRNKAAMHYEDLVEGISAERHLKMTQVEIDWAKDPNKYPKTTRLLHQKIR
tara:strand:+ start:1839 stop:2309 length:471 start_codon:yes stop_codon:yes gene_type:complete